MYTERAVRFLAAFTAVRQAGREAEGDLFVEDLLSYLLSLAQARASLCPTSSAMGPLTDIKQCRCQSHSRCVLGAGVALCAKRVRMQADDKAVRQRVCQVLAAALAQQAELSPDVAEELEAALLARLRDKLPAVRAEAAKALSMFADPGPVRTSLRWALAACGWPGDRSSQEHRGFGGRERPLGRKTRQADLPQPSWCRCKWLPLEQACEPPALRSQRAGSVTAYTLQTCGLLLPCSQVSTRAVVGVTEGQVLCGRTRTSPAAPCARACWRCCARRRTRCARSSRRASPYSRRAVWPRLPHQAHGLNTRTGRAFLLSRCGRCYPCAGSSRVKQGARFSSVLGGGPGMTESQGPHGCAGCAQGGAGGTAGRARVGAPGGARRAHA